MMATTRNYSSWLLLLAVIFKSLGTHVCGQECPEDDQDVLYPRVFMGFNKGPSPDKGNRTTFTSAVGSCMNIDALIEAMLDYYEPYGFDVESIRRRPFDLYEDPRFTLMPISYNQNGNYRILYESFYEYANSINVPLDWASWFITAKTSVDGPRGHFEPGDWGIFGIIRISMPAGDMCIQYNERVPNPKAFVEGKATTMDFEVYNDIWGKGTSNALVLFNGGEEDVSIMFSFPA